MSKKRKREYDDDDGRVIASMNVDGMPWYAPPSPNEEEGEAPKLTFAEKRAFNAGVLKAVALVGGVFVLGFTLFILFCVFVWFK